MGLRLAALAIVTSVTLFPLLASAEEPWYSVYRGDHRDWTVAVSGGFALMDLDGGATIDESLGDTDISFAGTLDLPEVETYWAEAELQLFRGQHLRFTYTPMRFSGDEVLDQAIVVDGTTYGIGDLVDSELRFDQYEFAFFSKIWLGEFVNVAPLVQVSLVDAAFEITNETLSLSEKESALLPLPYLGLRAEAFPLARLEVFAEVKGMTIGSPATIWDVTGGLAMHLTRNLSLVGRYRLSDYAVEFSDTEIDLETGGPYIGARVRF